MMPLFGLTVPGNAIANSNVRVHTVVLWLQRRQQLDEQKLGVVGVSGNISGSRITQLPKKSLDHNMSAVCQTDQQLPTNV